jgi:hypothetical protein
MDVGPFRGILYIHPAGSNVTDRPTLFFSPLRRVFEPILELLPRELSVTPLVLLLNL